MFAQLGPIGTVSVRTAGATLILLIIWRSQLIRKYSRQAYLQAALLGLVLGSMNLSFYLALSRIPLGIAATLEFLGPLVLAIVQSRKLLDILWVLLALSGIFLLSPIHITGAVAYNPLGILLALLAGFFWAMYILFTARVGKHFPGGTGLALASLTSACFLIPAGILSAGATLLNPWLLLLGFGVSFLCTALPYSLEMEALRHVSTRIFSILLSLEPAIAALSGWLLLHEQLTWLAILALILISVASFGVMLFQPPGESVP
jgi:inner membrane transporter RhtA